MIPPDADTDDSSDVGAWDFESALELIRFQTLTLGLNHDKASDADSRPSSFREIESATDLISLPSLGNFEEVLKYFNFSQEATFDSEDEIAFHNERVDQEFSTPLNDKSEANRTDAPLSSDQDPELSHRKRDHDLESQDRRRLIHNLIGFSDDDRLAKRRSKDNPLPSTSNKGSVVNQSLGTKARLAGPDKKLQIMELLFSDAKQSALMAGLTSSGVFPLHRTTVGSLHVFVDISNILIGFHDALKRIRGISKDVRIPRERLCFFNFSLILERGRSIAKRILAGSDDLESVEEARQLGYEVNLLQRVYKDRDPTTIRRGGRRRRDATSGESESEGFGYGRRRVEQGVDEILHLKMLESIVDTEIPGVIVLASGDAAEAEYSGGFLRMIERALIRGWKVEIVAFRENLSKAYRSANWLGKWGDSITIIELDTFAELLRLD